ncbi:hypothetical protein PHET_03294 [Paragonimus heterotremus]|uniref:Uncharacterized protein n=1 Tax=Paragonimus heterotremus TaxID=100268 RepID=A0A8J4SR82_9TREM|nr:hypothetical protein PHET_03294 [Paragonimus heterotremus]
MITPPKHPYNLNLNCFSSSSTSLTLSPSLRSSMTTIADRQAETILCTRPSSLPAYGGQPCDFLSNLDALSTRTHPLPRGLSSQSKSHADICSARPVPPTNFSLGCRASPVQHDPAAVVEPYPDHPYISTKSSNTVAIEPHASIPLTSSSAIGIHGQSFTERNVLQDTKISESVSVPITQVSTDPCVTASYVYTNRMCSTTTDNKTCSITVHFPALCAHPNVGFFLDLASNVHLPALENDECWDNHLRLVNVLITLTDQTGRILHHTCNFERQFLLSAESVELQDQNWAHLVDDADSVLWSTHFSKALDEALCRSSHQHPITDTELDNVLCDSTENEATSKAVNESVVPVRLLDCPVYRVQLAGHRFFVRTFSMPANRELSAHEEGTWSHLSLDVDMHGAVNRSPILVHYHTLIKECDTKVTDDDLHHVIRPANSSVSPSDTPAPCSVQSDHRRSSLVKINTSPVMTSSPVGTIALGHNQINPSQSSTITYPTQSVIPRSPVSHVDESVPIERDRQSQSNDSIFDNVNPTVTYHHHHWPLKTHPSPFKSTCKSALSVNPFEKSNDPLDIEFSTQNRHVHADNNLELDQSAVLHNHHLHHYHHRHHHPDPAHDLHLHYHVHHHHRRHLQDPKTPQPNHRLCLNDNENFPTSRSAVISESVRARPLAVSQVSSSEMVRPFLADSYIHSAKCPPSTTSFLTSGRSLIESCELIPNAGVTIVTDRHPFQRKLPTCDTTSPALHVNSAYCAAKSPVSTMSPHTNEAVAFPAGSTNQFANLVSCSTSLSTTETRLTTSKQEHGERVMLLQNLLPPEAVEQIRQIWHDIFSRKPLPAPHHTSGSIPVTTATVASSNSAISDSQLREHFARRVRQVVRQYLGPNALINTSQLARQLPSVATTTPPTTQSATTPKDATRPGITPSTLATQSSGSAIPLAARTRRDQTTDTKTTNYPVVSVLSNIAQLNAATQESQWVFAPIRSNDSDTSDAQGPKVLIASPSIILPVTTNVPDYRALRSTESSESAIFPQLETCDSMWQKQQRQQQPPPNMCIADLNASRRASGNSQCCMLEWLLSEEADLGLLPASFYESKYNTTNTLSSSAATTSSGHSIAEPTESIMFTNLSRRSPSSYVPKNECSTPNNSVHDNPTLTKVNLKQPLSIQLPYNGSLPTIPTTTDVVNPFYSSVLVSPVTPTSSTGVSQPLLCSPTTTIVYTPYPLHGHEPDRSTVLLRSSSMHNPVTSTVTAAVATCGRTPVSVGSSPTSLKTGSLLVHIDSLFSQRLLHPSTSTTTCPNTSISGSNNDNINYQSGLMAGSEPSSPCLPKSDADNPPRRSSEGGLGHSLIVNCRAPDSLVANRLFSPTNESGGGAADHTGSGYNNNNAKRRRSGPPTPQLISAVRAQTPVRIRHVSSQVESVSGRARSHAGLPSPPITSLTQLLLQDFPPASNEDGSDFGSSGCAAVTNTPGHRSPLRDTSQFTGNSVTSKVAVRLEESQFVGANCSSSGDSTQTTWSTQSPESSLVFATNTMSAVNPPSSTFSMQADGSAAAVSSVTPHHDQHIVILPPRSSSHGSVCCVGPVIRDMQPATSLVQVLNDKWITSAPVLSNGVPHISTNSREPPSCSSLGTQSSLCRLLLDPHLGPQEFTNDFHTTIKSPTPSLSSPVNRILTDSATSRTPWTPTCKESSRDVYDFSTTGSDSKGSPRSKSTESLSDTVFLEAGSFTSHPVQAGYGTMRDSESHYRPSTDSADAPGLSPKVIAEEVEFLYEILRRDEIETSSCSANDAAGCFSPRSKRSRLDTTGASSEHSFRSDTDDQLDSVEKSQADAQAVARICEQLQQGFTSRQSNSSQSCSSAQTSFSQVLGPSRLPSSSTLVRPESKSVRQVSQNFVDVIRTGPDSTTVAWSPVDQLSPDRVPCATSRSLNRAAVAAARASQQAAANQRRKMSGQRLLVEQRKRLLQHQLFNQVTVYSPNSSSVPAFPSEVALSSPLLISPPLISPTRTNQTPFCQRSSTSSPLVCNPTNRSSKRLNTGPAPPTPLNSTRSSPFRDNCFSLNATTVVAISPATISSSSLISPGYYRHRPENLSRYLKEVGPNVQVQLSPTTPVENTSGSFPSATSPIRSTRFNPVKTDGSKQELVSSPTFVYQSPAHTVQYIQTSVMESRSNVPIGQTIHTATAMPTHITMARSRGGASKVSTCSGMGPVVPGSTPVSIPDYSSSHYDHIDASTPQSHAVGGAVESCFYRTRGSRACKRSTPRKTSVVPSLQSSDTFVCCPSNATHTQPCVFINRPKHLEPILSNPVSNTVVSTSRTTYSSVLSDEQSYYYTSTAQPHISVGSQLAPSYPELVDSTALSVVRWSESCCGRDQISNVATDTASYLLGYIPTSVSVTHNTPVRQQCDDITPASSLSVPNCNSTQPTAAFLIPLPDQSASLVDRSVNTIVLSSPPAQALTTRPQTLKVVPATTDLSSYRSDTSASTAPYSDMSVVSAFASMHQDRIPSTCSVKTEDLFHQSTDESTLLSLPPVTHHTIVSEPVLNEITDRSIVHFGAVADIDPKHEDSLLPEDLINDVFDLETMVASKHRQEKLDHLDRTVYLKDDGSIMPGSAYSDCSLDPNDVDGCTGLTAFPSTASSSPSPCSPRLITNLPSDSRPCLTP